MGPLNMDRATSAGGYGGLSQHVAPPGSVSPTVGGGAPSESGNILNYPYSYDQD